MQMRADLRVKYNCWPGPKYLYVQRGCRGKNRCLYCGITNPPGRHASVDKVIEQLRTFSREGVFRIAFYDDNFVANKVWCKKLLDRIEAEKLHERISFCALVRADMQDHELLRQLLRLGFELQVGVETLDPEKAEMFGKVPRGHGDEYVANVREFFDEIGKFAKENSSIPVSVVAFTILCGESL